MFDLIDRSRHLLFTKNRPAIFGAFGSSVVLAQHRLHDQQSVCCARATCFEYTNSMSRTDITQPSAIYKAIRLDMALNKKPHTRLRYILGWVSRGACTQIDHVPTFPIFRQATQWLYIGCVCVFWLSSAVKRFLYFLIFYMYFAWSVMCLAVPIIIPLIITNKSSPYSTGRTYAWLRFLFVRQRCLLMVCKLTQFTGCFFFSFFFTVSYRPLTVVVVVVAVGWYLLFYSYI